MQIMYCENCNKKITERDFELGSAGLVDNQILCRPCYDKQDFNGARFNADGTSSGMVRAIPGSGIRSASSGLRVPPMGNGIWRKGGSGIGSGIRPRPGSGQRAASKSADAAALKDTGAPQPGQRRKSISRFRRKAGDSFIPIMGILVGILIGVGVFILIKHL